MSTALHPFDEHLRDVTDRARALRPWTPDDGSMPTIYLGHGAPPLFEDAGWMRELFDWTERLPKPTGIVIVSAHWEAAPAMITQTAAGTPLVYDFGGFDPMYYRMQYATPDAGELGRRVQALMPDTEPVHEHPSRGLDHGAWVPLKVMYPLADVPVLQLSMPTESPDRLRRLGERLRPLREDGVLVIGSGYLTHGLPFLRPEHFVNKGTTPQWSADFDAWAADALATGDLDRLADFHRAPGMPYAHPTAEHYVPLFVALGAASRPEQVETVIEGYGLGLSKRSIQLA